jgi:GNAT superfamily N-acetyltransferase
MALEQMRRDARRRAWAQRFYWPEYERLGGVRSGYVWEARGGIVGNVSLRPALELGGFFIGNVCVHPDYRRRGIARVLMETALRDIRRHGGRWVGLEVRADNVEARRLYERMGFDEAGRTLRLLRPGCRATDPPESRVAGYTWRRAVQRDSQALFRLAQASIPLPLQRLLELRRADYEAGWGRALDAWFSGKRICWWVAEDDGGIRGAVRATRNRPRAPDRIEVLAGPDCAGRLGVALGRRGMASLGRRRRKVVESVLCTHQVQLAAALEELGFQRSHVLAQLRLNLRSSPSPISHEPPTTDRFAEQ